MTLRVISRNVIGLVLLGSVCTNPACGQSADILQGLEMQVRELQNYFDQNHSQVVEDRTLLQIAQRPLPEKDDETALHQRRREIQREVEHIEHKKRRVAEEREQADDDQQRRVLQQLIELMTRNQHEIRRHLPQLRPSGPPEVLEHHELMEREERRREHRHPEHRTSPDVRHEAEHREREERREREEHRGPEQAMQRVHALHEAAEHLAHSGLPDVAHELRRRAEELERDIHAQHAHGPEPVAMLREVMANMDQLRHEVRQVNQKLEMVLKRLNLVPTGKPGSQFRGGPPTLKQPQKSPPAIRRPPQPERLRQQTAEPRPEHRPAQRPDQRPEPRL
ncbi:MAG: hypothetical protein RIK87_18200 [Fuerstiella sp.]